MTPPVSVIRPACNAARSLPAAVEPALSEASCRMADLGRAVTIGVLELGTGAGPVPGVLPKEVSP